MDIQASALTKILANLFVFIALLSCLGVVLFDHITGRPIANYFLTILGSGVAYAISVVSNHQGATIGVAQEIESMNSDQTIVSKAIVPAKEK